MNHYASLLVWELGRVALLVALAALAVTFLLKAVRSNSPKFHRLAWCAVLLQGWLLVRLPVAVPWYAPPAPTLGESTASEASLTAPSLVESETIASPPMVGGPASVVTSPPPSSFAESAGSPPAVPVAESLVVPDSPSPQLAALMTDDSTALADETEPPVAGFSSAAAFLPATDLTSYAPAIATLWLAGMIACVALWILGYVRFLRRLRSGQSVDAAWRDQWNELLRQNNIRRAIPLRVTGDLGPLLCHRPRGYELLVPAPLWRDLSESQRAAILRHELAHYRRADVWKSLAVRVLALPQWFNPFAWLAVRRFDEAAEWACDQWATSGQPRATDYARALVRLGEAATRQASYRPAAQGRSLAVRVRRLLSNTTHEDSVMKKTLLIAATAALVAVGLVRLELVARETAPDPNLLVGEETDAEVNASDDDTEFMRRLYLDVTGLPPNYEDVRAYLADQRDPKVKNETLIAQLVGTPETANGDHSAVAKAAGQAFMAFQAAYETDTVTLEGLCHWSQRWRDAECKAARDANETRAALEAYLQRTQKIHDKVKALHGVGARGGEQEKYFSMVFYLEEAKDLLRAAGRGKDADLAKAAHQDSGIRSAIIDRKLAEDRPLQEMNRRLESLRIAAEDAEKKYNSPDAAKRVRQTMKLVEQLMQARIVEIKDEVNAALDKVMEAHEPVGTSRSALIARKWSEDRQLQELKLHRETLEVYALALEKRSAAAEEVDSIRKKLKLVDDAVKQRKAELVKELDGPKIGNKPAGAAVPPANPSTDPTLEVVSTEKAHADLARHRDAVVRQLAKDRRLAEMQEYYTALEAEAVAMEAGGKNPKAAVRLRGAMRSTEKQIETRRDQIIQEFLDSLPKAAAAGEADAAKSKPAIERAQSNDRRLQELLDYYDMLEAEALEEEGRSKSPKAGTRLREAMKFVAKQIEDRKAQIEKEAGSSVGKTTNAEPLDKPISTAIAIDRSRPPQRVSALLRVRYAESESRPPDPAEARTFRATQAELLRSLSVLRHALREPGIAQLSILNEQPNPIAWLEENIKAQYEGDSEILRVQLVSNRPEEAAKVVNAVVKAYLDDVVYGSARTRKANRDALQKQYNAREEMILSLRRKTADRAKALGLVENAQNIQIRLLFDEVAVLRTAVTTMSALVSNAEIEMFDVETKLKIETDPAKREAYVAGKLSEDKRLREMKEQLDTLESEAVNEEKKSSSPAAGKRTRGQMKEVEAAIAKRKSVLEQEFSAAHIDSKAVELQGQLDIARKKLERYKEQLQTAQQSLAKKEKELNDTKIASVELDDMRDTLRNHEALRSKMFAELEAMKLEADSPSRVSPFEEAQVPPAK